MNDQIYLILILVFIILVLSRFIVRLYNTDNQKAKGAIYFFRMLLGFLIAMLVFVIVEAIRGNNVIKRFFGS
jgi:VIT1/CCC1 family predicted Fe2+/Mn2+ transporter